MPAFRPVVNIFFQIYDYTNCWIYYPASKYLAAIDTHKNMGESSIALMKVKLCNTSECVSRGMHSWAEFVVFMCGSGAGDHKVILPFPVHHEFSLYFLTMKKRQRWGDKYLVPHKHGGKWKLLADAPLIMLASLPSEHHLRKIKGCLTGEKFVFWLRHTACRLFVDEARSLQRILSSYPSEALWLCLLSSIVCDCLVFALWFYVSS